MKQKLDDGTSNICAGLGNYSIIDRRANGKGKSVGNREKFLKRIKEHIKKALPEIIKNRKIKDIDSKGGVVHIPGKGISEPSFRHGNGGVWHSTRPGNKDFNAGDKFKKPGGAQSQRKGAGDDENSEDDFSVEISREEFLDYFFEDLALPDLVKQSLKDTKIVKYTSAGFTSTGSPAKLDVSRSLRNARGRRMVSRSPYKKRLSDAEDRLAFLTAYVEGQKDPDGTLVRDYESEQIEMADLEKTIIGLKRKIDNVPFLDPLDLRYRSTIPVIVPITSAVMICLMDVSGSMGEFEKTLSRKFFTLLYMFLARKYEKVTLRFVIHTTNAIEVTEEEFFSTRESGGTVVSSGLDLVNEIIDKDYANAHTNVYVCQCSDGDNYEEDNGTCFEILIDDIMPKVQYFAYIEVGGSTEYTSDIDQSYELVAAECPHFQKRAVFEDADIYPVFRELFERKD